MLESVKLTEINLQIWNGSFDLNDFFKSRNTLPGVRIHLQYGHRINNL